MLNGKGSYSYPDGSKYTGDFINDKRNGSGVHVNHEGDTYSGDFKDDEVTGFGILSLSDGHVVSGYFKNGRYFGPEQPKMNPFISMFIFPRKTVQYVIDFIPDKFLILFPTLYGISQFLSFAVRKGLGVKFGLPGTITLALFAGALIGLAKIGLFCYILHSVGKYLGGESSEEDIRIAISWALLPYIFLLLIWPLQIYFFGEDLFLKEAQKNFAWYVLLPQNIAKVWTYYLSVIALSHVQRFSTLLAAINYFLPGLLLALPYLFLLFTYGGR